MSISSGIRTCLQPSKYIVRIGFSQPAPYLWQRSADLEITVQMLVQMDKLVQLIESPVFTCKYYFSTSKHLNMLHQISDCNC